MDVQIEQIGPCKKQVSISVPPEEIKTRIEESYVQLRTTVDSSMDRNPMIRGFRKGHVPRRLLEKMFGEQVINEVRENVIMESFQKGLDDNNLTPIGEPDFGDLPESIEDEKAFEFKVTVEVKPEFDIDGYKGIEVTKPSVAASDEDIAERVEHIRERSARPEKVEKGGAKDKDILTCSLTLFEGDKEVLSRDNVYGLVGGQGIAGIEIEKFADLVKGVKVDEERDTEVTLPDNFSEESLRGKKVKLVLKVNEIQRPVLPEMDEEWAKSIGFESIEALREAVSRQVEREKEGEAQREMERQIEEKLVELVDFELPEGLVTRYTDNILRRGRMQMMQQGLAEEDIEKKMEEQRPSSTEEGTKQCKLFFILDKIGQKEKIFATEDDMQRAIQSMAMQYRQKPIEVVEMLDRQGGMSELRSSIREGKIRRLLMEEAGQDESGTDTGKSADSDGKQSK